MQDIYQIYLPVAGTSINVLVLIALGLGVGLLSGMFSIGGSMICVPVLVFIGIPPQVAIVTATNQMIASSFSGYLVYARSALVDYKLSLVMLCGSIIGVLTGIWLFSLLSFLGHVDLFVSIGLVLTLSIAGFLAAKDAARIIYYKYKKIKLPESQISNIAKHIRILCVYFPSIRAKISVILPLLVGMVGGFTLSFVGIGGSILMLPMALHILGTMPSYTVGTIQFHVIFSAIFATILHAMTSQSLDIVLSFALIIGSVFGTHIGARISARFNQETFKVLLGFLIIMLCLRVAINLFVMPKDLYHIEFLNQ